MNHFDKLKKLIGYEEEEEIREFQESFLKRTPEEREKAGLALLRLKIEEFHYTSAGHRLVTFRYANVRPLPLYSPDVGDVVTLSPSHEDVYEVPGGTVYEKDKKDITVAFNRELPEWAQEGGLYDLNIGGNRATFKRMREALDQVKEADHTRLAYFRDLSQGLKKPETFDEIPIEKIAFFNNRLNQWQKEAVKTALEVKDVALVHGPPGTGKTTALIEIIRQAVAAGHFVFATAPSNTACDNLLEGLIQTGVPVIRLGHPARIMKHLRLHTLDFKLSHHPMAKLLDEHEARLERLFVQRDRHKHRRVNTRAERKETQQDIELLRDEIKKLDKEIFNNVVNETMVMVGTHSSATDPILRKRNFDFVIMDEASQATEPMAWIPMLKAEKVILAGDHYQLPPTVRSKKAEEGGLNVTLFERFYELLPDAHKVLLKTQYRMHEKIMNFSSKKFYEGKLIADESVRTHTLADLPHVQSAPETREVFLFLDTAGRGFEEELEPGSESRFNREEANLLLVHLKKLLALGLQPHEIAVISPYSAQVRLLASMMPDPAIEVDSVDGFQGREKEAVLLSLVRANMLGEMGFLTDTRRMNVAMTRARRKLVMIGDSATLGSIPFYRDFIQYAESIGGYRSSWEEI